jgi:hypothetical protein
VRAVVVTALVAGCASHRVPPVVTPPGAAGIDPIHDALGSPPAGTVWAGAAKVDISPPGPAYLAGFSPGRRSTGVHDPLYARCTFLDDGATPLVLVVLDLVGFLHRDVLAARARITERFPAGVIIASTHVHAAPDTLGLWGPGWLVPVGSGIDPAYIENVERGAARCAVEAASHARPATARFVRAQAPADLSYNVHAEERPATATAKDDELNVMQWIDAAGKGIATVVSWACHPEALGRDNTLVTADYPGVLAGELEVRFGGTAMLVNGAIGGLVTVRVPETDPKDFELARSVGTRIAEAVGRELESERVTTWAPAADGFVTVAHETRVPFENGWWRFFRWLGLLDIDLDEQGRATTTVTAWRVGPSTWLTVPGELFPSLGRRYKAEMKTPFRFLVGLGQDELGYIMEAGEFADELYGYEQMMSPGPTTGDVVTAGAEAALDALADARGAVPGEEAR